MIDIDLEDRRIAEAVKAGLLSEKLAATLRQMVREENRPAAEIAAEGDPSRSEEERAHRKALDRVLDPN